ncbi:hypothetical protein ACWD5V_24270 [Streptomyces sp. NPDC002523]
MSDVDKLVTTFKALSLGTGLSADRLNEPRYAELLGLLTPSGDREAALHVLDGLIGDLLEPPFAQFMDHIGPKVTKPAVPKAVRVALAIGKDDEGNDLGSHGLLDARRGWASEVTDGGSKEDLYFQAGGVKTHSRYEVLGFRALARLVLARADDPAFHEATRHQLAHPELTAGTTEDRAHQPSPPAESEDMAFIAALRGAFGKRPLPTTEREYALLVYPFVGAVAVVAVVVTLVVTGVISLRPHTKDRPDKVTSAGVPSSVKVTSTPQIDNTRGWGPARKTFTMQRPAPYPVFNSITDNPTQGDERNFVQCKDADEGNERYADDLVAKDHHTYECFALVVNDIAPNLDSIASPNTGGNVAAKLQKARLRVWFPENHTYNPGLTVILSANNSNPSEVWDSCNFVAARPVSLRYVLGSARLHTNGTPDEGIPLPGAEDAPIHDKGALLGDNGNGLIGQNGGYVLFKMSVTLG